MRFLGAGAMGAVYEVSDPQGNRFAAKTLLRELEAGHDAMARFVREGSTSTLDHPNVISVFDAAMDPVLQVPFFVMPLLQGYDLETLLQRVGALHPTVAARIFVQACRGLGFAHANGIVHRDIKPSNLFLHHSPDGSVTVKVCDFGIAKWSTEARGDITRTGSMLGTPLYMSPEQAKNAKGVDARADIWSLAMSLYHALAGTAALERVNGMAELLLAIVRGNVPHLQDAAPWTHPQLAMLVHGALVTKPEQRCPDMALFAGALAPFTGGSELLADYMLGPLPDDLRAKHAARAELPATWAELSASRASQQLPAYNAKRDPLIGAVLGNRYSVTRLIGKGGMGAIYEARCSDSSLVAVKVVLDSGERRRPEVLRRFVREARVLTSINSPNVVRVLDVDCDEGRDFPFIVMELLNGTGLDSLVKKWGALEPAPAVRAIIQLAQGLAAAHALGIVHRDIKPANLFLHELPTGEVIPKLCDFGIAKRTVVSEEATVDLTRTGGVVGSPAYMSPEQAKSAKHVDARTDIWSLGISLWELLCGRRPWDQCSSVGEIIVAICTEDVVPLQDVAPWIDPGLARAVHRCLERDPRARYARVEELMDALEPYATRTVPLARSMLVPISTERRSSVAPRLASAGTTAGTAFPGGRPSGLPSRRRGTWVAASVAGLAVCGVVGFVALRATGPKVVPELAASPLVSGNAGVRGPFHATVAVGPVGAQVTVDGAVRSLENGRLALEGQAGDSFEVVVTLGGLRVERTVVMTKDGMAQPDRVELAVAAPVGSGQVVRGAAPAIKPAVVARVSAMPTVAAPAATAPTPRVVAPATPATGIKPAEVF
jgi:serine/threonine protein kinase